MGEGYGYDLLYGMVRRSREYRANPFQLPVTLARAWAMDEVPPAHGARLTSRSWTDQHSTPGPDQRTSAFESLLEDSRAFGSHGSRL